MAIGILRPAILRLGQMSVKTNGSGGTPLLNLRALAREFMKRVLYREATTPTCGRLVVEEAVSKFPSSILLASSHQSEELIKLARITFK